MLCARGKSKEIPSIRQQQDSVSSPAVLQPGAVLGWEMEQERGEMGSDFHLPCLGLLGHLPLPHSLLLLHGAKLWEWEMLVWEEIKG